MFRDLRLKAHRFLVREPVAIRMAVQGVVTFLAAQGVIDEDTSQLQDSLIIVVTAFVNFGLTGSARSRVIPVKTVEAERGL